MNCDEMNFWVDDIWHRLGGEYWYLDQAKPDEGVLGLRLQGLQIERLIDEDCSTYYPREI